MRRQSVVFVGVLAVAAVAMAPAAQQAERVAIQVDSSAPLGPMTTMWAWFGHDEPNYTYTPNGQKLLSELAAASPAPVFVRVHNLLTTGDGKYALKWGSTNAYTEDANGRPVYDWTIVDRIVDTYLERKMKPFIQLGFMPQALSRKPEPYRHFWKPGEPYSNIYTGWAHPPVDFAKWGELAYQMTRHFVQKYGKRGSGAMVVRSVERARHRLLARHVRGVPEAVRLRRRRGEARAADGEHRRSRSDRAQRRPHTAMAPRLHRALPARHQLRDRQDRLAPRSGDVPRQGRPVGPSGRVRPDERVESAPRHRQRLQDRGLVSRAGEDAHRDRRVRSGGMCRLRRSARIPRMRIATARCTRAIPPNRSREPISSPTCTR